MTRTDSANRYSCSLLTAAQAQADRGLYSDWEALLARENTINLLYASPTWFDHLALLKVTDLSLAVVRNEDGQLVGVCPIQKMPLDLPFDVSSHALLNSSLRSLAITGCEPLFPDQAVGFRQFFRLLLDSTPECDCIYLENIPTECAAWKYLQGEGGNSQDYSIYIPYGVRPWRWLVLEGSFEQYLAQHGNKTRNTLRRQVKALREHGGGSLVVHRIDKEEQIEHFMAKANHVSAKSWQQRVLGQRLNTGVHTEAGFSDLARRGILRSYLLEVGGQPVAFVVGLQYRGVFHYDEVGFDATLAPAFSPGTVLLYLIIEDLFLYNQPAILNFGVGDAVYKQRFANRSGEDTAVLLMRRSVRNHMRLAAHRAFRSTVSLTKRMLQKFSKRS